MSIAQALSDAQARVAFLSAHIDKPLDFRDEEARRSRADLEIEQKVWKARAQELENALPYTGRSDQDLAVAKDKAEVASEEANGKLLALGKGQEDTARHNIAKRAADAAAQHFYSMRSETNRRAKELSFERGLTRLAEKQALEQASEEKKQRIAEAQRKAREANALAAAQIQEMNSHHWSNAPSEQHVASLRRQLRQQLAEQNAENGIG